MSMNFSNIGGTVRETIILIHGTFSQPKPNEYKWYQPRSSFCEKLDAQLSELGSHARCWAHLTNENQNGYFYWTGENTMEARTKAAKLLADYVIDLVRDGWQCHIVAHSHGGNILLQALNSDSIKNSWNNGELVLLGTPIYNPLKEARSIQISKILILMGITVTIFVTSIWAAVTNTELPLLDLNHRVWWIVSAFWFVMLLRWLITICCQSIVNWFERCLRVLDMDPGAGWRGGEEYLHVINSNEDEAFNFLNQILKSSNPWINDTKQTDHDNAKKCIKETVILTNSIIRRFFSFFGVIVNSGV